MSLAEDEVLDLSIRGRDLEMKCVVMGESGMIKIEIIQWLQLLVMRSKERAWK